MREISPDARKTLTFTVEESMQASFGGRLIHPVLSTWALVHHLEWVARLLLEPALEDGEEGVGAGVDIRHLSPALRGAAVTVSAGVREQRPRLLVCDVAARCEGRKVASGRVFQAVRSRKELEAARSAGPTPSDGEE